MNLPGTEIDHVSTYSPTEPKTQIRIVEPQHNNVAAV